MSDKNNFFFGMLVNKWSRHALTGSREYKSFSVYVSTFARNPETIKRELIRRGWEVVRIEPKWSGVEITAVKAV